MRDDAMTAQPMDVRHLLVFEPDSRGHAAEWIEHLMRKIQSDGWPFQVSLAVPVQLADEVIGRRDERWQSRVRVLPLHSWETALCNRGPLAVSGLARWWIMRRRLRQASADHGLFLGIDHLTLPLALGLGFGASRVSGILFRPSIHYSSEPDAPPPTARERLRDLRKSVLYRLTLRNPSLRAVRSLDPYFPAYATRYFPQADKIRAVPDPVHPIDMAQPSNGVHLAEIPGNRVLFVIFGVLSERKGVLTLIEALRRLESRYAASIAVYAAGQIEPRLAKRLMEALDELADFRPELWWRIEDRRLSTAELAALIRRADVVLAPYQRFVGSSGVLLWAAKAGKPVITQEYGLLGRLAREFGLGMAVDTSDPSVLAAAIAAAVRRGAQTLTDADGMNRFVDARTPEAFAASVIEAVGGTSALRPVALRSNVGEIATTD